MLRIRRPSAALVAPLAAVAMLVTGGAAAAQAPSPTQLRVELSVDIDYVDPALSYYVPTWAIEYATCAKLVNYPDRPAPEGGRLQPEVARAMPTVSPDGKTYTFELRDGFVFSPSSNERVTARQLQVGDRPRAEPADELAGAGVLRRHRRSPGGHQRNHELDFRGRCRREDAPDHPRAVRAATSWRDSRCRSRARFRSRSRSIRTESTRRFPRPARTTSPAGHVTARSLVKENPNYTGDRPQHFDEIHSGSACRSRRSSCKSIRARRTGETCLRPPTGATASGTGRAQPGLLPEAAVLLLPDADGPVPRDEPRPAAVRRRPSPGQGLDSGNVALKQAVNFAIDRTRCWSSAAPPPVTRPISPALRHAGIRDADLPEPARSRPSPTICGWQPGGPCVKASSTARTARRRRRPARSCRRTCRDRPEHGDQALPARDAVRARRPARRAVRHDARGLARDRQDPFDFVPVDGSMIRPRTTRTSRTSTIPSTTRRSPSERLHGSRAGRRSALLDVEIARSGAVGRVRRAERPVLLLRPRRVPELLACVHAQSRCALPPSRDLDRRRSMAEGDRPETVNFTVTLTEVGDADYPVTAVCDRGWDRGPADYERIRHVTFGPVRTPRRSASTCRRYGGRARRDVRPGTLVAVQGNHGTVRRDRADPQRRRADKTPPRIRAPSQAPPIPRATGHRILRWKRTGTEPRTTPTSPGTRSSGRRRPRRSPTMSSTSPGPPTQGARGGEWWFHVRAVDTGGNPASGAAHPGPFLIDTRAGGSGRV